MSVESNIVRASKVPDAWKDAMFELYGRYFCNISRRAFADDLAEKNWVIVLRDGNEIVGFSTLQVLHLAVDAVERVFLFSGDTVVDRAHWHDSTLAGCFGHFMLRLMREWPDVPLDWFLITKGYRTYRFLPVYFKTFYPAHDRQTPPEYARLLRAVAAHKFGAAYDAQAGLIRFGGSKDRLTSEMCAVPPSRRDDPHVRFFLARNPGYTAGDELACIADISRDNLNKYAWRVIQNTTVSWHRADGRHSDLDNPPRYL